MSDDNSETKKDFSSTKVARRPVDVQRMKLEKLMKNPEKLAFIPDLAKEKKFPDAPEFVRNVMGSSAGAGSGEFHVYRHIRRREYSRNIYLQKSKEKQIMDEEFRKGIDDLKKAADAKTAKKRAKRQRMKMKKRLKRLNKNDKEENKESDTEESEEEEEEEEELSEKSDKDKLEDTRTSEEMTSNGDEIKQKSEKEIGMNKDMPNNSDKKPELHGDLSVKSGKEPENDKGNEMAQKSGNEYEINKMSKNSDKEPGLEKDTSVKSDKEPKTDIDAFKKLDNENSTEKLEDLGKEVEEDR